MSWGISQNATEKEKIFADFNDSLNGMNSADGLSYHHYSCIYDIGRKLADKEYQQGRADALEIDEDSVRFTNEQKAWVKKYIIRQNKARYELGAREFAEWLCKGIVPQDNPHITYSVRKMLNDGSSYEVEAEELLAEWQKGEGK